MNLTTKLVLLFAMVLVGACSDSTGPNPLIAGMYDLETVSGIPVPIELQHVRLNSSTLRIDENQTFILSLDLTSPNADPTQPPIDYVQTFSGTWSQRGNEYHFMEGFNSLMTATSSRTTITANLEGGVYLYRRR